ncbi:hypothetical protein GCM10027075_10490 [Streptomyces heilongjiangensis]
MAGDPLAAGVSEPAAKPRTGAADSAVRRTVRPALRGRRPPRSLAPSGAPLNPARIGLGSWHVCLARF